MAGPAASVVQWLPDGTPRSPRFDDIYRSAGLDGQGGLAQARQVFLAGCDLPAAWRNASTWTLLETGFGLGLNFLATWRAWLDDPEAPGRLHYVAVEAWPVEASDLRRSAEPFPELRPLAEILASHWPGLLPGWQRLEFAEGRLNLSLGIGDARERLREQQARVDSVYLDGFDPARNPDIWDPRTLKAVAGLCRRGTRVATWSVARPVRDALLQCGFVVERSEGLPPKRHRLAGRWDPPWVPRTSAPGRTEPIPWSAQRGPRQALVIGAGLAGASCAHSLATRGWQVQVIERGPHPAAGASGLPVGLVAPHVSPDDRPLSRLTRAGLRATLARAGQCLVEGRDWAPSGVLEHRVKEGRALPADWLVDGAAGSHWSRPASAEQRARAGLAPDAPAHWHAQAAWLRPTALVHALLARAGITVRCGRTAAVLERRHDGWCARDADGQTLGEAPLVVVAAGFDSLALLPRLGITPLPLNALRGQIAWGPMPSEGPATPDANAAGDSTCRSALPPFPVNGHGSLITGQPSELGPAWVFGSTFERDCPEALVRPEDTQINLDKLRGLLPEAAKRLQPQFETGLVRAWAGVRCTVPDRLPCVGPLDDAALPGLWTCTGMGARGLTLAVLCGELAAAWLEAEPLPVERRLAALLAAGRWLPAA